MIDLKLTKTEMQGLTEDEKEIAMARKLEILILPILRRNMDFFYAGGNLKGKASAYRTPNDKKDLIETLKQRNGKSIATVCKPLCQMVAEILQENGINAETVSCDTDIFRHTDVLITTKSGKKYIINYLEDMENIQTGMATPDFASEKYYERRYKKFESGLTTDGKNLEQIDFLDKAIIDKIDKNLGYKKQNMYMDTVIAQIKKEFEKFREIMAENEWLTEELNLERNNATEEEKEKRKKEIYTKYANMTDEEELEAKLDWIFNYFNQRMNIKGHADFVMYYSRLLLKEVLSEEEYGAIARYDCFINRNQIKTNEKINNVLDFENLDSKRKLRFCIIKAGESAYAFSTKPNSFEKFTLEELEQLQKYANISKSERPSDLMLYLCDRGNALPLVFHPLGSKILNERASLISEDVSEEERAKIIKELSDNIKTTDEPVTSILIPYPDGTQKYLYINENDEFVIKEDNKEKIYHYNEETDEFNIEEEELEK